MLYSEILSMKKRAAERLYELRGISQLQPWRGSRIGGKSRKGVGVSDS